MAYVRKNLTPQQRHDQAVKAALAVKNHNGGRKKGVPNRKTDPKTIGVAVRSVSMREPDYTVFSKMAAVTGKTVIDFMHFAAERLKELNPKVFEPPPEVTVFKRR